MCIIERNLWFSKRDVFFIAFVRREEVVFGLVRVRVRSRRSSPIGVVLLLFLVWGVKQEMGFGL